MTVLSLQVTDEFAQWIKTKANLAGKSWQDYVIESVKKQEYSKPKEYEYTTDDFNEETLESIREMEENRHQKKRYTSADELMDDVLGKNWQNA